MPKVMFVDSGVEVDAVLEDNSGNIVGIEVKASEIARTEDFAGPRHLQRKLGSRFLAGIVLYCGAQTLPFGPGSACMSISALWETNLGQGGPAAASRDRESLR
jgi:hypothetical protein